MAGLGRNTHPPLPFLLAALDPSPWWLLVLASSSAAALVVLLLQHLKRTNLESGVIWILLITSIAAPTFVMLATQDLPASIGITILFIAFRDYETYIEEGLAVHAFRCGLWLALAFFCIPAAVVFALSLSVFLPLSMREGTLAKRLSAALVIVFPSLTAIFTWGYLSWLYTGIWQWTYPLAKNIVSLSWHLIPVLYLATGTLLLIQQPRRLLAHGVPLVALIFLPYLGVDGNLLLSGLFTLFALAGLPSRIPPLGVAILVVAALTQCYLSFQDPGADHGAWWQAQTQDTLIPKDNLAKTICGRLARAPNHGILTDDRATWRLIAQTGSARPFMLPPEPGFFVQASNPSRMTSYLLLRSNHDNGLLQVYLRKPPKRMILEAHFGSYLLYRLDNTPPLLATNYAP